MLQAPPPFCEHPQVTILDEVVAVPLTKLQFAMLSGEVPQASGIDTIVGVPSARLQVPLIYCELPQVTVKTKLLTLHSEVSGPGDVRRCGNEPLVSIGKCRI